MSAFNLTDFSLDALINKEFNAVIREDVFFNKESIPDIVDGKEIKSIKNTKAFFILDIEAHRKVLVFYTDEILDYAYELFPQIISIGLNKRIRLEVQFITQDSEDNDGGYNTAHIPFNNSIYIFSPKIIDSRRNIYDFFATHGIKAFVRDLDYYQQQWEIRRPDVFISHDSADKAAVAEPLYHALTTKGLKVWFDKYTLNLGDSLTEKINEGIAECQYGVLILSKAFLTNERWAKRELKSFSVKDAVEDSHKLIPVWHGINEQDLIATNNHWLIDKLGGNTDDIEKLAEAIAKVVAKP